MKQFSRIIIVLSLVFALSLPGNAAADPVVNVTDSCTPSATDGSSETYSGKYLGICALVAAKEQGAISSYGLSYFPGFGFFVDSLNGTTADSSSQYWALYKNDVYSDTDGLSTLSVTSGDTVSLKLSDFSNAVVGPVVTIRIGSLVTTTPVPAPASPQRGGGLTLHVPFDVPLALNFLAGAQRADGSFDSLMLSDWAAIAYAGGGAGDAKMRLAQYFIANPPALASVTDNERHAMALEALGINPYSGTSVDYIAPIVSAFDGTQVGDPSLVNDDIFALLPLLHSGYTVNDGLVIKTTAFIVSQQKTDGSWAESVDMTAAGAQALNMIKTFPGVSDAIAKAISYLRAQQKTDGGFGNSFSTSWALQAISATSDSYIDWSQGYFTPQYYLATQQQTDGGVEPATTDVKTRAWATAYAILAVERKTWHSLLASFEKPGTAAPEIQETATTATTSSIAPTPAKPAEEPERLSSVTAQKQEIPAYQESVAPVSEPASSTQATTTLARISPQLVQTASIAAVDYEIPNLWKWLLAFLLLAFAGGIVRGFRKRRKFER
ncbi:MAG: hypothetical protein UY44_C0015G0023 [Candidatus Kaiserbacteria bacterium GW2011_GWA2_49_19]|uniref:Prenyltransferase/squalene oxidase n=1 Tax=Candidatus Kaiserbacteria bacterium GW2011_GWA2_49_19 TaxID=1618669 RepID=A0A0G1XZY7_9BACT|nr:MAG: hypothetical protein UY44_C0015G0023 [Candidatus Kaiserbacteria bacterium GW2011_GWA2_49_19]